MGRQIVIRADASDLIGTGHLMRCLTLANEAADRGWSVCFVMRTPMEDIVKRILNSGHSVRTLFNIEQQKTVTRGAIRHSHWLAVTQEVDARQTRSIVQELKADWVIVDHYALDATWHHIIEQSCKKIFVIDDLADRDLYCSLLLNQNISPSAEAYRGKVSAECKCLIGPKYALLRKEFQEWRSRSIARRYTKPLKKILITMGGVDASDYTLQVLHELEKSDFAAKCEFIVVLGPAYPHKIDLDKFISLSRLSIKCRFDIRNMAETMTYSDMCVGAAGSTSWERCCLGLPTLIFSTAENQLEISYALEEHGIALRSSTETIRDDFDKLLRHDNSLLLKSLVDNALAACDGLGVVRAVDYMEGINENCYTEFKS